MSERIPKGAAMKGLEQDMYQAYKVSEYAAGRTPKSFEDWRETLTDADIPKSEDVNPISYTAPEKKRTRDSAAVNAKLRKIWVGDKEIGNKPDLVVIDDMKKEKRVEQKQVEDGKECKDCNTVKPLSEFYKSKTAKDGLENKCKACRKIYMKNYHKKTSNTKADKPKKEKESIKESIEEKVQEQQSEFKGGMFLISREELVAFGLECYKKGANTLPPYFTQKVCKELISEIVS